MEKVYILKEVNENGTSILDGGVYLTEKSLKDGVCRRINREIDKLDEDIKLLTEAVCKYGELHNYLDQEFVGNDYITRRTKLYADSHLHDVMMIACMGYRRYLKTGTTYFYSLHSLKYLKKTLKEKKHNSIKLRVTLNTIKDVPISNFTKINGMNFEIDTLNILE